MMRYILSVVALVASAFGQAPSITNITNAAIPALDQPPNHIRLKPRSMATIFGSNLADSVVSIAPPWQRSLGGTEIHVVVDQITYGVDGGLNYTAPCSSDCEIVADLIYVSPTQINFMVPDAPLVRNSRIIQRSRIVLIRNGVRFDGRFDVSGGTGLVYIDPLLGDPINADFLLFQVGYDCLFSFSLTDPSACGVSWSQGQYRVALGAVTDASWNLITSDNPVHQGQSIALWATGLGGLSLSAATGLLQRTSPTSVGFGVAQYGKDIPSTVGSGSMGSFGLFQTRPAIWAGESPQFVGLNQINLNFPVCLTQAMATVEKRYDAFIIFESIVALNPTRVYLPFVVRPGDPDCVWLNTTTAIASSVYPSSVGQSVTFTATVEPSAATGTVTFFDGNTTLGSSALSNGTATFTTSNLSVGTHTIVATYNGDSNYGYSSATRTQIVKAATTTAVASSANPSISGVSLTFAATVSPSTATGKVTFFDGSSTLGSGTLSGGKATCFPPSNLGAGSHSITANYGGDSNYGSSSATLTQVVKLNTVVTLTSSSNAATFGQSATLTATVSPCCIATGTVTFFDGSSTLGSAAVVYLPQNGVIKATFATSSLSVGTHSLTARYTGDGISNGSTSTALTLTIWRISLTSSPNPSSFGQNVTFTACGIPDRVLGTLTFMNGTTELGTNNYVSSPCSSLGANILSVGTHSITARYRDSYGGSTSAVITQTVNAH